MPATRDVNVYAKLLHLRRRKGSIPLTDTSRDLSTGKQKAVDAALAEYNALRSEIVAKFASQYAFVGVGFTAVGIVVGYASSGNGRSTFLLAVPFISTVEILVYAGLAAQVRFMGRYIRTDLWPYIQAACDPLLPSWEANLHGSRRSVWFDRFSSASGTAICGLFYLIGLIVAIVAPDVPSIARTGSAIVVTLAALGGLGLVVRERRFS
jgi:hypothetical protein